MWIAPTKEEAEKAFDHFVKVYEDKCPKETQCLEKDRDALLSFYDYPAAHWRSLRTTNPIESVFATVKLRTAKTRGCLSKETGEMMAFKLMESASKRWIRLGGAEKVADVLNNIIFINGEKQAPENLKDAA